MNIDHLIWSTEKADKISWEMGRTDSRLSYKNLWSTIIAADKELSTITRIFIQADTMPGFQWTDYEIKLINDTIFW